MNMRKVFEIFAKTTVKKPRAYFRLPSGLQVVVRFERKFSAHARGRKFSSQPGALFIWESHLDVPPPQPPRRHCGFIDAGGRFAPMRLSASDINSLAAQLLDTDSLQRSINERDWLRPC